MTDRAEKGKSIIEFPENYTVVDLETTGLSTEYDVIIELAAIRVRNNEITDTYQSIVKDREFWGLPSYVEELTGITEEMVMNAPNLDDKIQEYIDFIGEDTIIGHNVSFDINFMYDSSMNANGEPVRNNYVDTMRIARKALKDLAHHRLKDLKKYYQIAGNQHRGLPDCETTKQCYDKLRADVEAQGGIEIFKKHYKKKAKLKAEEITSECTGDEDNLLYGKVCVFTGKLDKMERRKAMQIVADIGGTNADSVTKKTNYLILGCNDYCKSIKDGKSNKQKKAEKMILEGQDISIIDENTFYEIAAEYL